jgi:hypothetical protein
MATAARHRGPAPGLLQRGSRTVAAALAACSTPDSRWRCAGRRSRGRPQHGGEGLRVLAIARLAAGTATRWTSQRRCRPGVHRPGRDGRSAAPEGHRRGQGLSRSRHHGQDDHRRSCRHGAVDRPPTGDHQGGRDGAHRRELAALDDRGAARVVHRSTSSRASNPSRSCAWSGRCRPTARWWR